MNSMLTTTIATVLLIYTFMSFVYWSYFSKFRRQLTYAMEPINDFLISLRLGPLSQNLSFISTLILITLISNHPGLPVWRPFMGDNEQLSGTLSKTAGVLLAVLAFITTTTANAVRDRSQGGTHFGRFLSTYLISKSYTSSLLWTPIFKLFSLIVFLYPFISSSLSAEQTDLALLSIPNPHLIGNAVWLSCFIIVGLTVLLNVLSLLRQTFIQLHQPSQFKFEIEEDIQIESKNEIKNLYLTDRASIPLHCETLFTSYIEFASSLPTEHERNMYFRVTLGSSVWRQSTNKLVSKLEVEYRTLNDISNASQAPKKQTRFWDKLLRSRTSTEERLHSAQLIMQGRHEAIIRKLDSQDTQSIRTKLINQLLVDASAVEACLNAAIHTISKEGTEVLKNCGLISQVNQIPDPQAIRNRIHLSDDQNLSKYIPSVVTVTAMTYRDLARTIQNGCSSKPPLSQHYSVESLHEIVCNANSIHHESTRRYALHQLTNALIDALIINRHPREEIPTNSLDTLISFPSNYSSSPLTENSGGSSNHLIPPIVEISLSCIKSHLTAGGLLSPESYSELLKYVSDEDAVAALLYMLLYSNLSKPRVSSKILRPFVERLRYHHGVSRNKKQDFYKVASVVLGESSRVSHIVTKSGLTWLFDILDNPVVGELYLDFMEKIYSKSVTIGFTDLVIWRAVVGNRIHFRDHFLDSKQSLLNDRQAEEAVNDIKDAAEILEKSGMSEEARNLRASLPDEEYSEEEQLRNLRQATSAHPLPHLHPGPTPSADRRLSNRQKRRLSRPIQ